MVRSNRGRRVMPKGVMRNLSKLSTFVEKRY